MSRPIPVSVAICTRNRARLLGRAIESIRPQLLPGDELLVVDDASTDDTEATARRLGARYVGAESNQGIARNRNRAVRAATRDVILFVDDDCVVEPDWRAALARAMTARPDADAWMGRVRIPKDGYLADCISDLGFPAGGNVGFDRMWPVGSDGTTTSLSTCNCAIRSSVFERFGAFEEEIPRWSSGEDTILAARLIDGGGTIVYWPEMVAWHEPRRGLASFLRWHLGRGRSVFFTRRHLGSIKRYGKTRLWSTANVLTHAAHEARLPTVGLLFVFAAICQLVGFWQARLGLMDTGQTYG